MPHKHKAKAADALSYNLPPSTIARSLPVGKHGQSVFGDDQQRRGTARKADAYKLDDTPKQFARMMARQTQKTKAPSALDDGNARSSKKRKRGQDDDATAKKPAKPKPQPSVAMPKILPGEKLGDFAARVDQALPVAGLTRKGNGALGTKDRQTKTEKRLHKMYADWRKEEARRQEKSEEAREQAEEDDDDDDEDNENETVELPVVGKKRRKRMIGEDKDDREDPWAELKLKRDAPKGLHDVAQAPPEFKVIPREKFKIRNGAIAQVADVPNAAGSLKRREELGEARKSIIEQYRQRMNRGAAV